jgi:hypothetical protein
MAQLDCYVIAPTPATTAALQLRNRPSTHQPTKELNAGEDLHESASLHPTICLDIPAFGVSLDSVTDTLKYNWDCAYVNKFLSWLKTSMWAR